MLIEHFDLFREASGSTERPTKAILFADLSGSTEIKGKMGEVAWLPTLGRFLDITSAAITEHGGTVVKYLGDGTLAAFNGEHAADAICAAIRIQEMLRSANSEGSLTDCLATVGIATGRVVEYEAPGGGLDYVGSVVDLAARLCGAGAPQAIWVDSVTIASANMNKVSSQMGRVHERTPDEYAPDEWKVELKGFAKPVKYREVVWHIKAFGATNEVVDEITARTETQAGRSPIPHPAPAADDTCEGVVKRWNPAQGSGFISTVSHGDFYVDRRYIANGEDLTEGRCARFVRRPPFKEGARPIAGCTVQEGHRLRGTFQRVLAHRGYGFVEVIDTLGNSQSLFLFLGENAAEHRQGQAVLVEASRNRKGISSHLIERGGDENGGSDADGHS
jgi:class 3 adenylate cyclase/cold shock CspA family protein